MIIKVTQEHIDNGKKCRTDTCAIAIAISESLEYPYQVRVILNESFTAICKIYSQNRNIKTIILPQRVQEFIESFDNDYKVEPMEFEINLQDESYSHTPSTN